MKNIDEMIGDTIKSVDEENQKDCEREVADIIKSIIQKQGSIKQLTEDILKLKSDLKKLQKPAEVNLEL